MTLLRVLVVLLFGILTLPVRLPLRWLRRRFGPPSNMVRIRADDPGLVAARERARATLPEFLRRLHAPGADVDSAAVKAALTLPNGETEHVWLNALRYEDGTFVGRVDNEADPATGVQAGDEWRIASEQISDWKIVERGQLVGGYSIRFFLARMPAAHRRAFEAAVPFTIGELAIPESA